VAGVLSPATGEYLLVRRGDSDDPLLVDFTFKRWERAECRLSPASRDPIFKPILIVPEDEGRTALLARFVEAMHFDSSEVTA
jgi:hypothetical protein